MCRHARPLLGSEDSLDARGVDRGCSLLSAVSLNHGGRLGSTQNPLDTGAYLFSARMLTGPTCVLSVQSFLQNCCKNKSGEESKPLLSASGEERNTSVTDKQIGSRNKRTNSYWRPGPYVVTNCVLLHISYSRHVVWMTDVHPLNTHIHTQRNGGLNRSTILRVELLLALLFM